MRVVHQLISYFQQHGALSEQQLDTLRANGFLPEELDDDLLRASKKIGGRRNADDGDSAFSPEEPLPGLAEPHPVAASKPLGIDLLCRQLTHISKDWDKRLDRLVRISRHVAKTESWQNSLYILHHCRDGQLKSTVREALDSRDVSLAGLSSCLDVQEYRDVLYTLRQRTKARGAYRALMRTYDFSSLGKYAWILKYPIVNDVFNLIRVKRAILYALGDLFEEDRRWLAQRFRGSAETNLFWAFVILRSATAEDPWLESRSKSSSQIGYLEKLWPPYTVLQRAALYAIFMAPQDVLSFLTSDFDVPEDARGNPPWIIPSDWTSPSEKHYINFSPD